MIVLCDDQVYGIFSTFSRTSLYRDLKDACKALVALDNEKFEEGQSAKNQNSLIYHDAMVLDAKTKLVMAAKHFLRANDITGMPPGVYLRINPKLLTRHQFEEMTGFKLPDGPAGATKAGYYLVAGAPVVLQQKGIFERIRRLIGIGRKNPRRGRTIH